MKLNPPIKCDDGTILEEVNPCESGVYLVFRVPGVQRGIRGKTRAKVDELFIVGVPWGFATRILANYGLSIERKEQRCDWVTCYY